MYILCELKNQYRLQGGRFRFGLAQQEYDGI